MENLYIQLEQLLGDFITGFLERVSDSNNLDSQSVFSCEMQSTYKNYLERFQKLKKTIENSSISSSEDALKKDRVLAILKSSSESIFKTFLYEN